MLLMLIKDLRISPMRTFLTGFSMFIGITAVILSVLVGTIGKSYLEATNEQLNGREPTVTVGVSGAYFSQTDSIHKFVELVSSSHPAFGAVFSPEDDVQFSYSSAAAGTESAETRSQLLADAGGAEALFITPGYNRVFNLPMTSGKWFSQRDHERLEAVINKPARDTLSDETRTIYASRKDSLALTPLPIVGVVNDGKDDPAIYINALAVAHFAGPLWNCQSATLFMLNKQGLGDDAIKSWVSDILDDSSGGQVSDVSRVSSSSAYADVTKMLQGGLAITAILLLFVSAVGLINIGLVTLEQRSGELLVRRALGATRGSVAMLVLGGALLLAAGVSALAIALSVGAVNVAGVFLPDDTPISPPPFPIMAAIIATGSAVLTALIGSVIPAIQAAKLQPALVLR
jgi:putative ABC transport system permease protein